MKRAIYKLARAYQRGTGTRLTADDVKDLVYRDTAMLDAVNNIIDDWETEKQSKSPPTPTRPEDRENDL